MKFEVVIFVILIFLLCRFAFVGCFPRVASRPRQNFLEVGMIQNKGGKETEPLKE